MRFLVILEGEENRICHSESEVFAYIEQIAEGMRRRGVDQVDDWINDFKNFQFSQRYTCFPELIIPLDGVTIEQLIF